MSISNSAEETFTLGAQAAAAAESGEVFALTGDLGAGKTQFVKGFVAGLASEAAVTSPTFTLVHEYSGGRLPVYHFDFYRLDSAEAALRLGLDEYLEGDGVCLIEWADRFPALLPPRTHWLTFVLRDEGTREIQGLPSK